MVVRIYLDFEATGLSTKNDHIIQIGSLATRQREQDDEPHQVGSFDCLVNTGRTICKRASEITGITNEMLVGQPSKKQAIGKWLRWITNIRHENEDVVFVAYNGLRYDFPLLCCEIERCGLDTRSSLSACGVVSFLDPLPWARENVDSGLLLRKKSGHSSYCLGDVHQALVGEKFENAHNALADTMALFRVCNTGQFKDMAGLTGHKKNEKTRNKHSASLACLVGSADGRNRRGVFKPMMSLMHMSKKRKREHDTTAGSGRANGVADGDADRAPHRETSPNGGQSKCMGHGMLPGDGGEESRGTQVCGVVGVGKRRKNTPVG